MASFDTQFALLKRKFNTHAGQIKRVHNHSLNMSEDNSSHINTFRGMLTELPSAFSNFNNVCEQLSELCITSDKASLFPTTDDQKIIDTVHSQYYNARGKGESHWPTHGPALSAADISTAIKDATLAAVAASTASHSSSEQVNTAFLNNTSTTLSRIRRPKISLPNFTGHNVSDWPLFRDTFEGLVHNEDMPVIEKYHCLLSSLSGSALALIKHIKVCEDNYNQAWALINKYYNNKRKLASAYITQLLNFKPTSHKSQAASLRAFLLNVLENITAFNNLSIQNKADFILLELAIRNLDSDTREAFEIEFSNSEFPTLENLNKFVESRYLALTMINDTKSDHSSKPISTSSFSNKGSSNLKPNKYQHSTVLLTNPDIKSKQVKRSLPSPSNHKHFPICFVCNKPHILKYCDKFHNMSPSSRLDILKNWKGCKNCLHPSHHTSKCASTYNCRVCNGHHHTLLHIPTNIHNTPYKRPDPSISGQTTTHSSDQPSTSTNVNTTLTAVNGSCNAMLGTIQAYMLDSKGHPKPIRIVIDSGSQFSLITKDCVNRLGLTMHDYSRSIRGVGSCPALQTLGKVSCTLQPRDKSSYELSTEAVVVPIITGNLPQVTLTINHRKHFNDFNLADPHFWKPGPIDYLLGADNFCDILSGLPVNLSDDLPKLLNTIFGYVIIGKLPDNIDLNSADVSLGIMACDSNIEQIMSKFWQVEEIEAHINPLSPNEQECENHFNSTHYRLPTGRYVVKYPFKSGSPPSNLSSSKQQALSRLLNLENKFIRNPSLRIQYNTFMKEYLDLGHMRLSPYPGEYYIPHHPVFKLEYGEPKIRVVFDASAKTTYGSLNEHLLIGQKLQNDISSIILRFRRHRIVFTCDIVKMYRQIHINPSDCTFQHILWRFDKDSPVEEYELLTVTYGTASAPFQALRVINQLVIDEGSKYPLAVDAVKHDRFVDDICSGASSVEEALEIKHQIISMLGAGEFTLSKWKSNHLSLLSDASDPIHSTPVSFVDSDGLTKILGLEWDPKEDILSYSTICPELKFSKRAILSAIGKIYDPLGYVAPATFLAKTILQETWKASLDWDDPVPEQLQQEWLIFVKDLPAFSSIKIPRWLQQSPDTACDVLGFCDASSKGYCACIYLRVTGPTSNCYLLKAKTKLAPIKPLTIPRLELNAALLLAKLYVSIKDILQPFNIQQTSLFTDASLVLGWLHTPAYKLKTYIANRVVKILDLVPVEWWNHISTNDNPADCGSRGMLPSALKTHSLWWSGPTCIDLPAPVTEPTILLSTSVSSKLITFTERYSSYPKLIRGIAYILRLKEHCLQKINKVGQPISSLELRVANLRLISYLQRFYYPEAFGNNPKWSHLLNSLGAFFDEGGVLRVGGRLSKSNLPYDQRHPILLPRRSHFTNIIIDHYHRLYLHVGPAALQANIVRHYWIPSARSVIKQRKRQCLTCIKYSKHNLAPRMADLPSSRFTEVRPFFITGVDFAGPFLVRESNRRKAPITKAYLSLFVCLSTKALHLDIVQSLSTEAFLDAFERFISRRGLPSEMISDRGTNFIGASNYLKEVNAWLKDDETRSSIQEYGAQRGVNWKFSVPATPHMGGIYEAGVKSVKSLLVKCMGGQPYLLSELSTMITKIEGILNSRPLYPLSSDPSDLQPLTPGHFLIGGPINALPEVELSDVPSNRLSHWQHLRERVQYFWKRWRQEYLSTLQRRNKWTKGRANLNVGELVLVTDINMPPYKWPLARITHVHPGEDGVTRAVTIRTATGVYKRPAIKLLSLGHITDPSHQSE